MHNKIVKHKTELTEENFNSMLPEYLQRASGVYFTPIHIAKTASQWLTEDGNKKVLDIGAGVGKFCITGARNSDSFFYGIEYRPGLVKLANKLAISFGTKNVLVSCANIFDVDFFRFDAFYLFNPFYENFEFQKRLNNEVTLISELYSYYSKYTKAQLERTKAGTRLVTYYGNHDEVPESFEKVKENNSLKLWIKR